MRVLPPLFLRAFLRPRRGRPGHAGRALRGRRARARRAVLSGALLVASFFLGCAAALDACPVVRHPEYGYKLEALKQLRREEPDRPLVVVVGSSRTLYAVNPAAMGLGEGPGEPLVFNFGLTAAQPFNLPMALHRLKAAGLRPEGVIVEVFPAQLHNDDPAQMGYADRGRGLTAAELFALPPGAHNRELFARWASSRLEAWLPLERYLLFTHNPAWLPPQVAAGFRQVALPDRFGYFRPGDAPVSFPEKIRQCQASRYRPLCAALAPSPLAVRSYREIVSECRAEGIPVALYLTPESDAFRSWYTPESRTRLAEFVRLCREELGCPVFDPSAGWAEEDFLDGHHMTATGAARFSRRFADEHLRPWLAANFPKP